MADFDSKLPVNVFRKMLGKHEVAPVDIPKAPPPAEGGDETIGGKTGNIYDKIKPIEAFKGSKIEKYQTPSEDKPALGEEKFSSAETPAESGGKDIAVSNNPELNAVFNAQPAEVQAAWLKSATELVKTAKNEALKRAAEIYLPLEGMRSLLPVMPLLAAVGKDVDARGITPAQYLENLITCDIVASTNPYSLIYQLMADNNITFKALMDNIGPHNKNLEAVKGEVAAKIRELKVDLKLDQIEENRKTEAAVAKMKAFADAVDSEGNLLHPYLNELSDLMYWLGCKYKTSDLNDLYLSALKMTAALIDDGKTENAPETAETAENDKEAEFSLLSAPNKKEAEKGKLDVEKFNEAISSLM